VQSLQEHGDEGWSLYWPKRKL